MEHKNSRIVDLKSIFFDFKNYLPKFYQKILFMILILRAQNLFSFKHGVLFCCSLCQAKTEVSQSFLDFMGIFLKSILNYLIPKIAFDFTAGRLSENVKI